jgi:hypothetical protein
MKIKKKIKSLKFWEVVLCSLFTSVILLCIERVVGIGWDYHPDSVFYATHSDEIYFNIVDDWLKVFNNGYYVVVHFLSQSVIVTTLMNMTAYSMTNAILYKTIKENSKYKIDFLLLMLLLFNPYRLHLSTTMLKDTLIILMMVLLVRGGIKTRAMSFFGLVLIRVASPIYIIALIPRRIFLYLIPAVLAVIYIMWPYVVLRVLEFNSQLMQFREFDNIPTFQDLGLLGAIIRGVVWSILGLSGVFAIVSPSPEFILVAIGPVITLIFIKKATGTYNIPLELLAAASIFGVMVTGYSSYIRYIYPLIVVWPIIAMKNND